MFNETYTLLRDIGYNPISALWWTVIQEYVVSYGPPEEKIVSPNWFKPFNLDEWNSQHDDQA